MIKQVSNKRRKQQAIWRAIVKVRTAELNNICEFCGRYGELNHPFNPLIGHHKDRRRGPQEDIPGNCFVCHWSCHQFIHLHRDIENAIKVGKYEHH